MSANIQSILEKLGIENTNPAFSTGNDWGGVNNSESIDSFSPVDGQKNCFG